MATDEVTQQERYERQLAKAIVRAERAEAELKTMREALGPFAAVPYYANTFNRAALSDEDFRKARAALAPSPAGREG